MCTVQPLALQACRVAPHNLIKRRIQAYSYELDILGTKNVFLLAILAVPRNFCFFCI